MANKDNNEPVDGAKIAADILKRLPLKDQERLVKSIKEEAPQVAVKIEANLYRFDDIIELTPKSVQALINQVAHSDLVLSLKTASVGVKNVLFTNMTERKRRQVQEDFDALAPTPVSEVESAQRRILEKLDDLRESGAAHSSAKKDVYA